MRRWASWSRRKGAPACTDTWPTPWEPEQVGHFLDTASEHRLGALFEVAVFTGIRRGALVALRWEDVDLTRREIRIRKDKTQAGKRRVALDDRVVGALVAWQIAQASEGRHGVLRTKRAVTCSRLRQPAAPHRPGREHARKRILVLVADLYIRAVDAETGQLLRELDLDPTKDYQPLGRPPGPPRTA